MKDIFQRGDFEIEITDMWDGTATLEIEFNSGHERGLIELTTDEVRQLLAKMEAIEDDL